MRPSPFEIAPIARHIWQDKYRFQPRQGMNGEGNEGGRQRLGDDTIADTFQRVANVAASAENAGRTRQHQWAVQFKESMRDFAFLPGGRILAGAGTHRRVTLFNCFVLGRIEDSLGPIFDSVREAALTMQQGGGIGQDFSTLRPKGAALKATGATASGPISFMDVWDSMCRTVMSAGARRGAMMATLRCDHPDIEEFITAKQTAGRLTNFNLSVLVTDAFMAALAANAPWDLVFDGKVYKTLPARDLWEKIMRSTFAFAEPGVIFIDRVNAANNLAYCETINATNPCGEQPLPEYGACLLGAMNLAQFISEPFTTNAAFDEQRFTRHIHTAVRMLDNIIEVSGYPLPAQRAEAFAKRRLGLGITGLADALTMSGVAYGSAEALDLTDRWLCALKRAAYDASADLAAEKGAFPAYDRDAMLERPNLKSLPGELRDKIARLGLRNGCLTTIAPTGTISLLAGNVSSGIEPAFDLKYRRTVLEPDGSKSEIEVEDYAAALHRRLTGREIDRRIAVTAQDLSPSAHLAMQAVAQRHIDSAISKTINCPKDINFEDFRQIYTDAYEAGLKGCTTYRPNETTGAVLQTSPLAFDCGDSCEIGTIPFATNAAATGI